MIIFLSGLLLAGEFPQVTMQVNRKNVAHCEQLELTLQVFSVEDVKIGMPSAKGMTFLLRSTDKNRTSNQ